MIAERRKGLRPQIYAELKDTRLFWVPANCGEVGAYTSDGRGGATYFYRFRGMECSITRKFIERYIRFYVTLEELHDARPDEKHFS